LVCNPILLIDNASGIQDGQVTNKPGSIIHFNMKPGVADPIRFLAPPPLSADVWKTQEWISEEMDTMGNVSGAVGESPTDDSSGELVKQLRYNNDRFIGPTVKRAVSEFVRLIQDWQAILPLLWTEEKVLSYTGEDQLARTVVISPDLWDGEIRIEPDMDSMLPESRSERQTRVFTLYQEGIFGPPGTPDSINSFLTLIKFPNPNRLDVRGGVHRVTAQQALGKLVQGANAMDIPIFEWYNLQVWQQVAEEFMSAPEYLKLQPGMQQEFTLLREKIMGALAVQQAQAMARAAPMAAMMATHQGAVAKTAQAAGPQQPALPPGGGGGGGKSPVNHAAGTAAGAQATQPQAAAPIATPNPQDAK
jgi:hypothetical protein